MVRTPPCFDSSLIPDLNCGGVPTLYKHISHKLQRLIDMIKVAHVSLEVHFLLAHFSRINK